jgi:hypothetical protein
MRECGSRVRHSPTTSVGRSNVPKSSSNASHLRSHPVAGATPSGTPYWRPPTAWRMPRPTAAPTLRHSYRHSCIRSRVAKTASDSHNAFGQNSTHFRHITYSEIGDNTNAPGERVAALRRRLRGNAVKSPMHSFPIAQSPNPTHRESHAREHPSGGVRSRCGRTKAVRDRAPGCAGWWRGGRRSCRHFAWPGSRTRPLIHS